MDSEVVGYFDNEDIITALQDISTKAGFKNFKHEISKISKKGDGYYGAIYKIKIVDSENENDLNLILKKALLGETVRSELPISQWYDNECYVYETVFPSLQNLEISNGLLPFNFMPKYYVGKVEDNKEFLIVEDLTERGYELHDRKVPLDSTHVELVLKTLGQFHAVSLALKDHQPEIFQQITAEREDLLKKAIESFKKLIFNDCNEALNTLDSEEDEEIVAYYKNFLENFELVYETVVNRPVDKYSVIIHGDFWSNNIMFKYEDKTIRATPTKLSIIDFQFSGIKSCVFDLAYFFFGSSSKQVISECDRYLDVYYNSFSSYLRKLGSNPDDLYPHSEFMREWKELAKFALFFTPLIIRISLSDDNEIINVDEENLSETSVENAFRYKIANQEDMNERIRETILYLVKNDLLS